MFQAIESPLVNFDQFDIATGRSVVTLYAATTSGANHVLSTKVINSNTLKTVGNPLAVVGSGRVFDMPVEKPLTIEGDAVVDAMFGANTGQTHYQALFFRVTSLGEEIAIASGASKGINAANDPASGAATLLTIPKTDFKVDETLRLRMNVYAVGGTPTLYHDPANRAIDGVAYSKLTVFMPFKVDI